MGIKVYFLVIISIFILVADKSNADDELEILGEIIAKENAHRLEEKRIHTFNNDNQLNIKNKSLVNWDNINLIKWNNLSDWEEDLQKRETFHNWRQNKKALSFNEIIGRVLDCFGDCRSYRGLGFSNTQYRSEIREGDDFVTLKNSYAWIYLIDGSLIRVSPETSISFNEVNLGKNKIFFFFRVNTGHLIWQNRSRKQFISTNIRETDTLFLPLQLFEANYIAQPSYENSYSFLVKDEKISNQYKKLNQLIVDNNSKVKTTEIVGFIVTANGSILTRNSNIEIIAGLEGGSYIRTFDQENLTSNQRTDTVSVVLAADELDLELNLEDDEEIDETSNNEHEVQLPIVEINPEAKFYFRGYANTNHEVLESNKWYKVNEDGRELNLLDINESKKFGHGNFFISNIPTILVAREIMLSKYSIGIFANENYRMWDNKTEISKRIDFLKEYTRRQETKMLKQQEKLKRNSRADLVINRKKYDLRFHKRAMDDYMLKGEGNEDALGMSEKLNSTKKKYWKYINVRR